MERLGVLMSKPVLWVAAGSHCIVVTKTDEVWGWGACSSGQLGPGLPKRIEEPALIASLSGKQLAKVYVADGRTAAVSSAGELWMCGEQVRRGITQDKRLERFTSEYLITLPSSAAR